MEARFRRKGVRNCPWAEFARVFSSLDRPRRAEPTWLVDAGRACFHFTDFVPFSSSVRLLNRMPILGTFSAFTWRQKCPTEQNITYARRVYVPGMLAKPFVLLGTASAMSSGNWIEVATIGISGCFSSEKLFGILHRQPMFIYSVTNTCWPSK